MSLYRRIKKFFQKNPPKGTAEYFAEIILDTSHSKEEWFTIRDEFEIFYDNASPAEISYIEESGADDMLYQLFEFLDYEDEYLNRDKL